MQTAGVPVIDKLADIAHGSKDTLVTDYTCVSFVPDMPRLTGEPNSLAIDSADYAVMCRRVLDVAGCAAGNLQVTLNGHDLSMSSFSEYVNLYRPFSDLSTVPSKGNGDEPIMESYASRVPPMLYKKLNPRWTVGVGLSTSGSFEAVSFVNGMATTRGGTHVNHIVQQVTKYIQSKIEKKDPTLGRMISPSLIRRHLFVACDALIENPTFDSQMKESLTSSPSSFGSACILTQTYLKNIVERVDEGGPGIVEEISQVAKGMQHATLLKQVGGKKNKRQILSIPKLDDAHKAGTADGWDCTLILTEGDSAKALAVAGLEVVGRDRYGVFPLRGKLLNVRDAVVSKLGANQEVKALMSILGLEFGKQYATTAQRRTLRYGRVMLMTDQDTGECCLSCPSMRAHSAVTNSCFLCFDILIRWFAHQRFGHELLPFLLAKAAPTTSGYAVCECSLPILIRNTLVESD